MGLLQDQWTEGIATISNAQTLYNIDVVTECQIREQVLCHEARFLADWHLKTSRL